MQTDSNTVLYTDIRKFQETVWEHYRSNKRDLPWRTTTSSYEILVSEIMLQQTQVNRVLVKYSEWLTLFPTISSLASADQSTVIKAWSGLGYNRRAIALHKTARVIIEHYEGTIPMDITLLKSLPGLGDYTAKAVYTFSTNSPSEFIETNIRSAFLHHFFHDQTNIKDAELFPLIEQALDRSNPREWYYALMDYGSWLKRSVSNPSVRSAKYSRQSKFQGSRRQARGIIIKELGAKEYLTTDDILQLTQRSREEVETIISDLVHEGFIHVTDLNISLSH
jgi:A/G-specific adenine glycosylase